MTNPNVQSIWGLAEAQKMIPVRVCTLVGLTDWTAVLVASIAASVSRGGGVPWWPPAGGDASCVMGVCLRWLMMGFAVPLSLQAYFRQGVALQYLGRHADALAAFASGLAQDPKSLQLLVGMVEAAMKSPMRGKHKGVLRVSPAAEVAGGGSFSPSVWGEENLKERISKFGFSAESGGCQEWSLKLQEEQKLSFCLRGTVRLRGTGDESEWVCTTVPVESLSFFPFSSISVGRGVCCCGPGCVVTGTTSHIVLVGSSTSEMPQASVCPEEHISSFSVVLLSLKIQHSRRQKGCSTNSLLFKQCLKSQRPWSHMSCAVFASLSSCPRFQDFFL